MDWKMFAGAISRSEITKDRPPKIIVNLFAAAGCMTEFTEDAARKWISGERKCKVSSYFPESKINNDDEAFHFFRKRPEDKLKVLQGLFREMGDPTSPIDVETDNLDEFCWSLVDQFLDLLGFQRLSGSTGAKLPDGHSDANKQVSSEVPIKVSKQPCSPEPEAMYHFFHNAVRDFPIKEFLDSEQIDILPNYLLQDAVTFWGRMDNKRKQEDAPDRTTEAYQAIVDFISALESYLLLLKENSISPGVFPNDFRLISSNGDEIRSQADSCREKVKELFLEACSAVGKEQASETAIHKTT